MYSLVLPVAHTLAELTRHCAVPADLSTVDSAIRYISRFRDQDGIVADRRV